MLYARRNETHNHNQQANKTNGTMTVKAADSPLLLNNFSKI